MVAGGGGDDDDDDAVPRTDLEERESGKRESDVVGLGGYLFGGRRHGREGTTSKQAVLVKTFFFSCAERWVALIHC